NFLQLGRYGCLSEQTYRNLFEHETFDWFAFNGSIINKHLTGKRKAIAIDPSYIPKSGKKTPWIGYFWSGCAGEYKRGLEIMGIGVSDIDTPDCMTFGSIQTPDCKTLDHMDKNLVDWYSSYLISLLFQAGTVDLVKRDIVSLYEEDFWKLDDTGRATALYDAIPAQLSKNASRYQISAAIPGERAERVASVVKMMNDFMSANVAYHSNDPNVGLALTMDNERFKIYTSDTGMFVTLAFKDKEFTDNIIYEKLLNDKLSTNLGYVYENVIAQMLRAAGKQLFYHTIPFADGKKYYEVDFLISDGHKVSPIEVKSSGYKSHTSLDAFCNKFSDRVKNKYIIYTKDLKREQGIDYIPVYMTMFL
ncbi:MAG: DUF4143 domain-containing protein, partial [Odoribacter sp.]|nr:DUF4143 domain-containing protein [Odoribacter sp.]